VVATAEATAAAGLLDHLENPRRGMAEATLVEAREGATMEAAVREIAVREVVARAATAEATAAAGLLDHLENPRRGVAEATLVEAVLGCGRTAQPLSRAGRWKAQRGPSFSEAHGLQTQDHEGQAVR